MAATAAPAPQIAMGSQALYSPAARIAASAPKTMIAQRASIAAASRGRPELKNAIRQMSWTSSAGKQKPSATSAAPLSAPRSNPAATTSAH